MATWVVGDTTPPLELALTQADGSAVDLTTATSVTVRSNDGAGHGLADAAMVITNAAGGAVSYAWQTGDTAVAGVCRCEVTVTWSDGTQETFPSTGSLFYTVSPRVVEP